MMDKNKLAQKLRESDTWDKEVTMKQGGNCMKGTGIIKQMLVDAGFGEVINSTQDGIFVNCADTQYITDNTDGSITMHTVGSSRYCWSFVHDPVEAAEVMIEQCKKTDTDIKNEYRGIWEMIGASPDNL